MTLATAALRPSPPQPDGWGRTMRDRWPLEPDMRFINHGAFGATPIALLEEQAQWRARMERNTARFFMRELPQLLRDAAAPLAAFVGTVPERIAFVTNATAGTTAVLRSLPFAPDDEIVFTDHVYNAVRNALHFVAGRTGARLVEARIGMPVATEEQVIEAVTASLSRRTRLIVIDHVVSASAVTFPVAAIAALGRARDIRVLVDGAHAPGLLDLDVDGVGADWYVGNCHKWLCAPKGSGFIAVADRTLPVVHPLAISHSYGEGFTAEFDKTGTHDPSAALTVPAAIALHRDMGGARLRARNRALALRAAESVAASLGTELGGAAALFHAMATVRLPGELPPTTDTTGMLRDVLWQRHRIEAAFNVVAGGVYLRISAQAYNDDADYDGLGPLVADAVTAVLQAQP